MFNLVTTSTDLLAPNQLNLFANKIKSNGSLELAEMLKFSKSNQNESALDLEVKVPEYYRNPYEERKQLRKQMNQKSDKSR